MVSFIYGLPWVTLFIALGAFIVAWLVISVMFRTVVTTNMVHIVQSAGKTTSYGTNQPGKNVYYSWPRALPRIGVSVIELPVSNFDLSLSGYKAYDKERVPFELDLTAFFRIADTNTAAQRVPGVKELHDQLLKIVQGAARKILASHDINQIMVDRATFGEQFTTEVKSELASWGVEPVKNMELMDIRDADGSKVISNIMAMKASEIEKTSRVTVAGNKQAAETAEINARQAVDVQKQVAEEAVGKRTAEKEQNVGVADQQARQQILEQERETATRTMAVKQVEQVQEAKIAKEKGIVDAEQDMQTKIIIADGALESDRRKALGIEALGTANGLAEKAMLMAPVDAQIALATAIAEKPGYQQYLQVIEAIKAHMVVGTKQAEALQHADIKVIANTGKATEGVSNVMDMFTSKGGTELAGMVEAFAQTPIGKGVLAKFGVTESPAASAHKTGNGITPPATASEATGQAS
ncbi:MAG: hypothetical protein KBD06_01425 [Candidatus Pacebacteria bacterium]|nr:hypothetical protein [Candidatus Paceibacterota bacterium]